MKPQIIFFGNGPLAEYAQATLAPFAEVVFWAKTKDDLEKVKELKRQNPKLIGVLASFGVLIKADVLELFEPEGILNLHPSLLPKYRGASPIESAILAGDEDFSYSVMKLVKAMDAGPIYYQETVSGLPMDKQAIYRALAERGARWIGENLAQIRKLEPVAQDEAGATFTKKYDKTMSKLQPEKYTAAEIFRQVVAYQGFPKPKYEFCGKMCIILRAHVAEGNDGAADGACADGGKNGGACANSENNNNARTDDGKNGGARADGGACADGGKNTLSIKCKDGRFVIVDELQPEGRKAMSAKAFLNGCVNGGAK